MRDNIFLALMTISLGILAQNSNEQYALFAVAGQSNAVGVGDSLKSIVPAPNSCFEYVWEKDLLKPLKDPIGTWENGFQPSSTGSFSPAFASKYYELNSKKVVIVQTAKGGSALHPKAETENLGRWDASSIQFNNAIKKIKAAEQKTGTKVKGIIWAQGENDGDAILPKKLITAQDYKACLIDLIKRFREQLGSKVPFYIIETGQRTDGYEKNKGYGIVRQMQRQVAKEVEKTHIIYDKTDKFVFQNRMSDVVHYNQDALNEIGTTIAANITKTEKRLPFFSNKGIYSIAHRGASKYAPENTISSIKKAWEMNADAAEIDIHLSKDDKIVVMHDDNTKRTTGFDFEISKTSSTMLRTLDNGKFYSDKYKGEKIAFLEEILNIIPEKKHLFIEIKTFDTTIVPILRDIIEKSGKISQVSLISFNFDILKLAKKETGLKSYLLCEFKGIEELKTLNTKIKEANIDGLDVQFQSITPEVDTFMKQENIYVLVWTINEIVDAKKLMQNNIYGITTDKPELVRESIR